MLGLFCTEWSLALFVWWYLRLGEFVHLTVFLCLSFMFLILSLIYIWFIIYFDLMSVVTF